MTITDKGMTASLDAIFSFVIITIMLLLTVWAFSQISEKQAEYNRKKELEIYSKYIVDSLIKNSDDNAITGIAEFDGEKHRVKSNEIEEKKIILLKNNERIYSAWTREKNGGDKVFFKKESGEKQCIAIERIALIHNQVVLFGVKTCE